MVSEGHIGQQFSRPSPRMKKYIRQVRTEERGGASYGQAGGQCGTVSEENEVKFGWPTVYGTHSAMNHNPDDEHVWNRLPDGRVLDSTADQFGDKSNRGIRIMKSDDSRLKDYRE